MTEQSPNPSTTTTMNFSTALLLLKDGNRVARTGWNGRGMWVELQRPLDGSSKMTLPYLFLSYPIDARVTPGARVPWLASQTDLLAEDWVLVVPDSEPEVTLVDEVGGVIARQLSENPIWGTDCRPFAREILLKAAEWLESQRYGMAALSLRDEAER